MDPLIWPGKSRTTSSYVRIRDVALKTCQRRWTIGRSGGRESGIPVPVARHHDDEMSCWKHDPISPPVTDPISPPVFIVHRCREVFQAISYISTELLYIGSSWSSFLCLSMWGGSPEYIAYEFVLRLRCPVCLVCLTSIVFVMRSWWPYSCYFLGVLLQGLAQYRSQYSCVIIVKMFLHMFS